MPPKAKESVAARKARERAEALAQHQLNERQDREVEEDKARQTVELNERVGYLELMNSFYEKLVNPASRLMIRRTEYDALRLQMREDAGVNAERMLAMQDRSEHMERSYEELNLELAHLRNDTRKMADIMKAEVARMRLRVEEKLEECAKDIEGRIMSRRNDALECGPHLNKVLEDNMIKILHYTKECQRTAQHVTTLQQEQSTLHSRIPKRVRSVLLSLEREDLVLILDTLSFEPSTLEYLLSRYPPLPDDPFLNKTGL